MPSKSDPTMIITTILIVGLMGFGIYSINKQAKIKAQAATIIAEPTDRALKLQESISRLESAREGIRNEIIALQQQKNALSKGNTTNWNINIKITLPSTSVVETKVEQEN